MPQQGACLEAEGREGPSSCVSCHAEGMKAFVETPDEIKVIMR